uniref:HNH endonuclease 5 domain-containing protein n=1 Tax=viral metagenome TaxID=1070528 RepID=A0A6C0F0Q5_9ZZZZ
MSNNNTIDLIADPSIIPITYPITYPTIDIITNDKKRKDNDYTVENIKRIKRIKLESDSNTNLIHSHTHPKPNVIKRKYIKTNKKRNNRKKRKYNKKNLRNINTYNHKISKTNTGNTNNLHAPEPDTHIPYHNHKEPIPKRIRELVWTTHNGETFSNKCYVSWCDNKLNVFNFQVGHDIPESKGGTIDIDNLKPICGNCNLSMGNKYTITEWSKLVLNKKDNFIS